MANEPSPQEGAALHRVLIVEDDKLMRVLYERLFKQQASDLAYHLEGSAETALEYLRANRVDAVVTDWDLPKINGIQLLKALRANPSTKTLPVVVVSGRTGPGYMDIAVRAGASDYFSKPFDIQVFLARLRELIRGAGGR